MSDSNEEPSSGSSAEEEQQEQQQVAKKRKKEAGGGFILEEAEDSSDDEDFNGSEEEEDGSEGSVDSLINDDIEEEEEEASKRKRKRKKKHVDVLEDEEDADDIELLKENLNAEAARDLQSKSYKRLKQHRDSDDEDEIVAQNAEELKAQLFSGDTYDAPAKSRKQVIESDDEDDFESDESDMAGFIEDDEPDADGAPAKKKKKRKKRNASRDVPWEQQEAYDIFGDAAEFERMFGGDDDEEAALDYDLDEDGEEINKRQKPKLSKKELYEPEELVRLHMTDADTRIKDTDQPERSQLRHGIRKKRDDRDYTREAEWIYREGFNHNFVSHLDDPVLQKIYYTKRDTSDTIQAIEATVRLLTWEENLDYGQDKDNEKDVAGPRDIAFIATYRKEQVMFPDVLNYHDLLLIQTYDVKYHQLEKKRRKMVATFSSVQEYQKEIQAKGVEVTEMIADEDVDRIKDAVTETELMDLSDYFSLHFGDAMREHAGKRVRRQTVYHQCRAANLLPLTKEFGLTPRGLAKNLEEGYKDVQPVNCAKMPHEIARDYLIGAYDTEEKVLSAARCCYAHQIAVDPTVRDHIRGKFERSATITTRPTKQGMKNIEDWHPYARYRYLTHKRVDNLKNSDFLWILHAVKAGQLSMEIAVPSADDATAVRMGAINSRSAARPATTGSVEAMLEELQENMEVEDTDELSKAWNQQRVLAIEYALHNILLPAMTVQLKDKLEEESRLYVLEQCANYIRNMVSRSPYTPDIPLDEDDDEGAMHSVSVLAIHVGQMDSKTPTYAVSLNAEGECIDWIRLDWVLLRRNPRRDADKKRRDDDFSALKDFITRVKPEAIVIGAEQRAAEYLKVEIEEVIQVLRMEEDVEQITCHFIEPSLARVYENSQRSLTEFKEYVAELRHAISLGRRFQSPELEVAGLFSVPEEPLCLTIHPLQAMMPQDKLLQVMTEEVIIAINRAGLDINRAITQPHVRVGLQFIAGLGPRKVDRLVMAIQRNEGNNRVYNRQQIEEFEKGIGPVVAHNCVGFLRIINTEDTYVMDANYVDALDCTRIHPESYVLAYKMAMDALDITHEGEGEMNLPSREKASDAVEETLRDADKLQELNLESFASKIRDIFGDKLTTLNDIRSEYLEPFKDHRHEYLPMTPEEKFMCLTGETIQIMKPDVLAHERKHLYFHAHVHEAPSLVTNMLLEGEVRQIRYKKQDMPPHVQRADDGAFECGTCFTKFPTEEQVNQHVMGNCPGKPTGFTVAIGNILGFVPMREISDNQVRTPADRVMPGKVVQCRLKRVNPEKYSLDLSTKSSQLRGETAEYSPVSWGWGDSYDHDMQKYDEEKVADKLRKKLQQTKYTKRAIDHPFYQHTSFAKAQRELDSKAPGYIMFRPSSKGDDHLTCTWKVAQDVYAHIDIKEEDKESPQALGRRLFIQGEEFEDLDEIVARYITPMTDYIRVMMSQEKFYRAMDLAGVTALVNEEKSKNPQRIPYFVTLMKNKPGCFHLSYRPGSKVRHEQIRVTPSGYKFRGQVHDNPMNLITWFKKHYADPPKKQSQQHRVPQHGQPSYHSGGDPYGQAPRYPAQQGRGPPPKSMSGYHPDRAAALWDSRQQQPPPRMDRPPPTHANGEWDYGATRGASGGSRGPPPPSRSYRDPGRSDHRR